MIPLCCEVFPFSVCTRRSCVCMAAGTQPAEQALQANTAGGLSARLRPQNKRPTVGRSCSKYTGRRLTSACLLPCSAGRWGVQWYWPSRRRAQTYLTSLPHLSPLPVTVPTHSLNLSKTHFGPNLTFFFVIISRRGDIEMHFVRPCVRASVRPSVRPC